METCASACTNVLEAMAITVLANSSKSTEMAQNREKYISWRCCTHQEQTDCSKFMAIRNDQKIHSGSDNCVRSCEVRITRNGERSVLYTRPVTELVLLIPDNC